MPSEKWGAELKITIDKGNSKTNRIAVLGDLRFPETLSEVNLVITTSRKKEQIDYDTQRINDFTNDVGAWARFAVIKKNDIELIAGDVIHIYLWNRTQARFDVDNLQVKMYSSK